jgi:hypothetical protein
VQLALQGDAIDFNHPAPKPLVRQKPPSLRLLTANIPLFTLREGEPLSLLRHDSRFIFQLKSTTSDPENPISLDAI